MHVWFWVHFLMQAQLVNFLATLIWQVSAGHQQDNGRETLTRLR
jgi:hypothetical protein